LYHIFSISSHFHHRVDNVNFPSFVNFICEVINGNVRSRSTSSSTNNKTVFLEVLSYLKSTETPTILMSEPLIVL